MISFLDSKELRKEAEAFALKAGNGKYAIISAHDRKGKPVTIKASGDERPDFVPPCFDKEAYDATLSAYPERKDLLASLFTYHRWDGKAFSPDEAEDHPILRAADYALRHKLEMTGIASFMINDGHIIYEESLPDTLWKMLGLRFIYADESIAVIDKDAGLLSAPGKGDEKLDSASYRFHRLFPSSPECCFTHRLDMDTSGLLVLAFTKEAHRNVSMQFEARTIKKEYEAILTGVLEEDEGTIIASMRLDTDHRPLQIIDEIYGKKAITRWKKLGTENGNTRVRFFPETGRTHQLRVHSRYIGHPIIGDRLYGIREEGQRLMLHASYIELNHPVSGQRISFSSPSPF